MDDDESNYLQFYVEDHYSETLQSVGAVPVHLITCKIFHQPFLFNTPLLFQLFVTPSQFFETRYCQQIQNEPLFKHLILPMFSCE